MIHKKYKHVLKVAWFYYAIAFFLCAGLILYRYSGKKEKIIIYQVCCVHVFKSAVHNSNAWWCCNIREDPHWGAKHQGRITSIDVT